MKSISEEGTVVWEEICKDGTELEHTIPFSVTFYKDHAFNSDADGNRGCTHAWTEEEYNYPREDLRKDQIAEIDSLVDDEIEMLGQHLGI